MNGHDPRFEQLDAGYVLGALSPEERRAYEDHLQGCTQCRAEVAELTALPGLMSRLDPVRAMELLPVAGAIPGSSTTGADLPPVRALGSGPATPPDLAARLHRQARRRQTRARLTAVGAALVAAAVAVIVVLGVQSLRPAPTLTAELAPTSATSAPADLTASVRLYAKAWGTEVDTECRHQDSAGGEQYPSVQYGLYVIGRDGSQSLVSSWQGIPKSPIETTAATSTTIDQMSRLELRTITDRHVLLAAPVHG